MTEEEKLAYLAGIIDGEGSIQVNKVYQGVKIYYRLSLTVVNTEEVLIIWLKENYGGNILKVDRTRYNDHYKDQFRWYMHGRTAYKLLERVKGVLLLKRAQAEVGMRFWEKCLSTNWGGRGGRPKWVLDRAEEFYKKMWELNGHRQDGRFTS